MLGFLMQALIVFALMFFATTTSAQPQIFELEIGSRINASTLKIRFGDIVQVDTMQVAFDDRNFRGARIRFQPKRLCLKGSERFMFCKP